ncbi:hypothetical protein ACHAWF_005222 [Thalassiosira exigua]
MQDVAESLLLPRVSAVKTGMENDGAAQVTYDAIDRNEDQLSSSLQSHPQKIQIDHDMVNHDGCPYRDAVADAVLRDVIDRDKGSQVIVEVSYWSLIKNNVNFRWYLMSYLVTHAGEWFTYVASISAIEQIQSSNDTMSRTSISVLVSLRLLPNALFTSIGGVLADSFDRRDVMWMLDVVGALVALLFLLAYHWKSILALYVATALQMTVAAMYEPSRSAIVSMLVGDEESLKKAITISELAWSVMTAVGSSAGGFATEYLGISICFWIDSLSYLMSAWFIWKIGGNYLAETSAESDSTATPSSKGGTPLFSLSQFTKMTSEGLAYLRSKPWGPFVFLKFCAALIYGAADVLNVSFSERGEGLDAIRMEGSSKRLGMLFGAVGMGCFFGPVIVDRFTRMDNAASLERACLGSFLLMAVGCYGLSRVKDFFWVCVFTSLRSAGSSIIWIQSSLLLQKFSVGTMLGRVISVDYALATLSEAFSAMCGGILQDDAGLSAEQVSFVMGLVALGAFAVWLVFLVVVRV